MGLLLRSLLLGLLTIAPVGAGQLSICEVGSFLHLNPHHHDDAIDPHALCTDTGESHHEEEPAPCSDDCSLILFDTPPIRSISNTPLTIPKIQTAYMDWINLYADASIRHIFTASQDPPDSRTLSCSPERICRFLN